MPLLTIHLAERTLRIPYTPGPSLRRILEGADLRVRAACKGSGACGMCRVKIEQGTLAPPTRDEQFHLGSEQLSAGIRLACKVRPEADLTLSFLIPPPISPWRILTERPYQQPCYVRGALSEVLSAKVATSYGLIVDIGTTTLTVALLDLNRREWLGGRSGKNPQSFLGADVVSRLIAAQDSPDDAATLSRLVIDAIGAALNDIGLREGVDPGQVTTCVLAGNTAMLSLLSGKNFHLLLRSDHWAKPVDCEPDSTSSWLETWGAPRQATVRLLPPLGGFVGSDLLAGLVAVNIAQDHNPGLFIDFGTNTEIALWDGGRLWVTSAAGGPAFEGCGLTCGSPAEAGAIYRVLPSGNASELVYETIQHGPPKGVCGSGLVDLLACLLDTGKLTNMGKFSPDVPAEGFEIAGPPDELRLTLRDVDLLQRAKAAIGAGVAVLLGNAGLAMTDLKRVFCAGTFGAHLNLTNARRIGLLPPSTQAIITSCGNTSLGGCEALLSFADAEELLNRLRTDARLINLSSSADFEPLFLDNLYLEPMAVTS